MQGNAAFETLESVFLLKMVQVRDRMYEKEKQEYNRGTGHYL